LNGAATHCALNTEVEQRAQELESGGFAALDALHLASAEWSEAGIFCTCDDRFLKKIRSRSDVTIRCLTPLELIQEVEI
jgi:predicted nucleic acid-binding protein